MTPFQQVKHWLVTTFDLGKDALHVHVGLVVLFGCAALFRWRLASGRPQLAVLALALAAEIWDVRDGLANRVPLSLGIPASIHDILNTMFWPVTILLLARFTHLLEPVAPAQEDNRSG
ncbi:MAG: hypothetical protein WDN24_08425 [Sphingomonas sp.]